MAEVLPTEGAVLLVRVERLGHLRPFNVKVTTPVTEPVPHHHQWQGKDVVAVLCHHQTEDTGHWVTYRKVQGVWIRLDSARIDIVEENPFEVQTDYCTVDLIAFKSM